MTDSGTAAVDLVSTIFEILAGRADADPSLVHVVATLRDIVSDWQDVYHSLENQLALALASNEALVTQVEGLRRDLKASREMYYRAEQRALDAGMGEEE